MSRMIRAFAIGALFMLVAPFLFPARPAAAEILAPLTVTPFALATPSPDQNENQPPKTPTTPGNPPQDANPTGVVESFTQIINQIIQFPVRDLQEALENAINGILKDALTPLERFFAASLGRWFLTSPGILTPGGGVANGQDAIRPAWDVMVRIAIFLWPLTLAIIATIAAKDAVTAASWGLGDLKYVLAEWLIAVIASATSIYWLDLSNQFGNATTTAILNAGFTSGAFDPNALTTMIFGAAGLLLIFSPGGGAITLFIVIFVIMLGMAVLTAIIFQFIARFAILYVLVALAPVVLILGVLPPVSWLRVLWLKGFVLVELLGPINALLIKLTMLLAARGVSNDPVTAFVEFLGVIGLLSVLITVDGVIIKGVFGAAAELAEKSMDMVKGIATLGLAAASGLAGGAIAGGASAAAGSSLGGGGGAPSGGFSWPSAISTAGRTLSASGNPFRPLGAAMSGVGDAMRQGQATGALPETNSANGHTPSETNLNEPEDTAKPTGLAADSNRLDARLPPAQAPSFSPTGAGAGNVPSTLRGDSHSNRLAPESISALGLLPEPLRSRAGNLASAFGDRQQQSAVAEASVAALNRLEMRGQDTSSLANAWDRGMASVLASARGGMALETMSHDAGFGNDVSGYMASRMSPENGGGFEMPANAIPWRAQLSPHDWDAGTGIASALGGSVSPGVAAQVYHELRSPESGGGWSHGVEFFQAARGAGSAAALEQRLAQWVDEKNAPAGALRLWRAGRS
ncbi:MAG: hypothetical protein HY327_12750 [Chloroflexi bacterium]|nr:hypothetical protein [Chloroflexota bacterium]